VLQETPLRFGAIVFALLSAAAGCGPAVEPIGSSRGPVTPQAGPPKQAPVTESAVGDGVETSSAAPADLFTPWPEQVPRLSGYRQHQLVIEGDQIRVECDYALGDLEARWQSSLEILEAEGWQAIDERRDDEGRAAMFRREASHLLVQLSELPEHGRIEVAISTLPAPREAPQVKGRCKQLPATAERTLRRYDFDGDGVLDVAIWPAAGKGWDVYVMRGTCGHRVAKQLRGALSSSPPMSSSDRGWARINMDDWSATVPEYTIYGFDGTRYRVIANNPADPPSP
jgi:hypothetical protein